MRICYGFALLLLSAYTGNAQVVINEFMSHPEDPKNEWVELYNPTDSAIPLHGWAIKDASKKTKGSLSGSVPARGYLVVARDSELLLDFYSDLESDCVIEATLSLNHIGVNGGDSIILSKADGSTADALYYQNRWGPEKGRSLERKRADMPASDSANWRPSTDADSATPCRPNSTLSGLQLGIPSPSHWVVRYDRSNRTIYTSWILGDLPLAITTFTMAGQQETTVTPTIESHETALPVTGHALWWRDGPAGSSNPNESYATKTTSTMIKTSSLPQQRVLDVDTHLTEDCWQHERPSALVVACSDGRLQQNLDDFLHNALGIIDYDRLYTPGGGGALAISGSELLRSDAYRHECQFLMKAHQITDIYFMFHGPSEDGPDESLCADYRRKFPNATAEQVRKQQQLDAQELQTVDWGIPVRIHAYRCEVRHDDRVQFVRLL